MKSHVPTLAFVLGSMGSVALASTTSSSSAFIPALLRPNLKTQLRRACEAKDETKIIHLCDELSKLNPTTNILQSFDKLSGQWKLDYTTAPITEVPESTDEVRTYQTIDATEGMIYNVIDRGLPVKGQRIGVGAEPTRPNRVALDFRTIDVYNDRFPKRVTLRFPPREFFRTISKVQSALKGEAFDEMKFKELAYFDVLFLDEDLRIQRNSEGNLFINSRI